jgi:hypothetical protein
MIDKSKEDTIINDEVSLIEATDPLDQYEILDTGDLESLEDYSLPYTITLDMIYSRNDKIRAQSDQYNINPNTTFKEFQYDLMIITDDSIRIQDDEEIVLEWKWEKRVIQ